MERIFKTNIMIKLNKLVILFLLWMPFAAIAQQQDSVMIRKIYDEVLQVSNDDAIATSRKIAQSEGLLVGISAGANIYAAQLVAARPENKGKTIVTILCDTGERYLSSGLYDYDEE